MLLWQQMAVAAYTCVSAPVPPATATMQMHSSCMPGMSGDCTDVPGASPSAICHQHCQPDQATGVEAPASSVPPNTLVGLPPMLLSTVVMTGPSNPAMAQFARLHKRRAPPTLLFCSLLI